MAFVLLIPFQYNSECIYLLLLTRSRSYLYLSPFEILQESISCMCMLSLWLGKTCVSSISFPRHAWILNTTDVRARTALDIWEKCILLMQFKVFKYHKKITLYNISDRRGGPLRIYFGIRLCSPNNFLNLFLPPMHSPTLSRVLFENKNLLSNCIRFSPLRCSL